MSAMTIALMIVVATAVILAVDAIQRARMFRGYEEIKADARQIATLLRGETARYDHDVVIAGNFGAFPVVVRFSQDANTPGLILQMTAPATFDLQLSPKTAPEVSGKTAIKTGMVGLDTRFNTSTGQAVQAKVFVTDPAVGGQMEQLCCSSQTFLVIESGGIELTEMLIPVDTARHVRSHMVAMEALARSLERMPGADSIRITPWRNQRSWVIRGAIAVGAIVLLALMFQQRGMNQGAIQEKQALAAPAGDLPLAMARNIPHLENWTMIGAGNFSDAASLFFRDRGLPASGHVEGRFSSPDETGAAAGDNPPESAFLLSNSKGQKRVIIMAGMTPGYDAVYYHVDLIAVIPAQNLEGVKWSVAPPEPLRGGDGLLVVENADDPSASIVLLRRGRQTYAGHPQDFTKINF